MSEFDAVDGSSTGARAPGMWAAIRAPTIRRSYPEGAVFDQHASLERREKKVARRDATEQRLTPMISPPSLHDLIVSQGYRLVEDAWESNGRRTYLHDEDADRAFLNKLKRDLQILEWKADRNKLRTFGHARSGEVIEIEPGGSDTSGHFLHHMKAFD